MRSLKERRNLSLFVDNITLYRENNLADKSLELIKAFRYKINTQNQFCVYNQKDSKIKQKMPFIIASI